MKSSAYFTNLIAKKQKVDGEAKLGWGQTTASDLAATAIGDARKGKREAKVNDSDLIDKTLPSIKGTVISVVKGNGSWTSFKLGIAVENVVVPEGSVSTFKAPSGAVYQVSTQKLHPSKANGEKVAMPHRFPAKCALVRIDGVVVVEIKGIKNGPNEAELKESDVAVGTKLKLNNVVFGFVHKPATDKYPESFAAYGNAQSIDYSVYAKGPAHPRQRKAAIFDALAYSCNGGHRQVIDVVCDHVGKLPPKLLEESNADKAALADYLEKTMNDYSDASIGVGQAWEEDLYDHGAEKSWRDTIGQLRNPSNTSLNILRASPVSPMLRSHCYPVVQYPVSLALANMCDRANTGLSSLVNLETNPEFCDLDDAQNPFVLSDTKNVCEVTLSLSADKRKRPEPTPDNPDPLGLTIEEISSRSLGSISLNAASFAFATRDDGDFEPNLLKTAEGSTVVVRQFLNSMRKLDLGNALGVYDYYRTWMLVNELAPFLPTVHFSSDWELAPKVDDITVQPKCENGWCGDGIDTVYDVATAVETVGVQVSKEFVEEFALDDERYLNVPSVPMQYSSEDKEKRAEPPKPSKLDVHGFVCLNGISETSINRIRKLPENSGYRLYVVYEGVTKDVNNDTDLNQDTAAGDIFMKDKFEDSIKAKLANTCAIYCVSHAL